MPAVLPEKQMEKLASILDFTGNNVGLANLVVNMQQSKTADDTTGAVAEISADLAEIQGGQLAVIDQVSTIDNKIDEMLAQFSVITEPIFAASAPAESPLQAQRILEESEQQLAPAI